MPCIREASHLKEKSIPLIPKDALELAMSETPGLTPLGALSVLPRELRDNIYYHVFNEGPPFTFCDYNSIWWGNEEPRKWRGEGLCMLQVSSAIREEFSALLFSKAVFRLQNYWRRHLIAQRSEIPFVDHIRNVDFFLDLPVKFEFAPHEQCFFSDAEGCLSASAKKLLSHFIDPPTRRNICSIRVDGCGPKKLSVLISSTFMHTLARLTSFKTVQLTLSSYVDDWLEEGETRQHTRTAYIGLGTCPEFDTWVLRMSRALEPALGPFTVTYKKRADGGPLLIWYQYVTFHPRCHPIEEAG